MAASQRKLVVASNRGPFRTVTVRGERQRTRSAGGLVTALDPVLRERGGVWVSATEAEDPPDFLDGSSATDGYRSASVELTRAEQSDFYTAVSNAVLWPLLHSFPTRTRVHEAPWQSYRDANEKFAATILDESEMRDLIWVHDYHLMLVPRMVRESRPRAAIGWYCHVPWPSPDIFAILPWRRELLEGLLGADVIGFHTESYARNFLACVEQLTDHLVHVRRMQVRVEGRRVRVLVAPIGIPVQDVQTIASDPDVIAHAQKLRHLVNGRRIVLGVDRLDYTKGIPERILAYERFLRSDRTARDRYVFVQVLVPSRTDVRDYATLKSEIDRLVGDINGRFSTTGKVAIHYLYRNLEQPALYAHYDAADVALVTPLRDGMNLVAHEYVASRVRADGVLILSELAGAARYLERALLVNPYDIAGVAEAIGVALKMPLAEQRRRMRSLHAEVMKLDVHRWAEGYLAALEAA